MSRKFKHRAGVAAAKLDQHASEEELLADAEANAELGFSADQLSWRTARPRIRLNWSYTPKIEFRVDGIPQIRLGLSKTPFQEFLGLHTSKVVPRFADLRSSVPSRSALIELREPPPGSPASDRRSWRALALAVTTSGCSGAYEHTPMVIASKSTP